MKQKSLKCMVLIFVISVSVLLFNMCSIKTKGTVIKSDTVEEMDYDNNPEYENDADDGAENEENVKEYDMDDEEN